MDSPSRSPSAGALDHLEFEMGVSEGPEEVEEAGEVVGEAEAPSAEPASGGDMETEILVLSREAAAYLYGASAAPCPARGRQAASVPPLFARSPS